MTNILKCIYCGKEFEAVSDMDYFICHNCANEQLLPRNRDIGFLKSYERAAYFWRNFNYGKAIPLIGKLLEESGDDAALNLLMFMSRYGIGTYKEDNSYKIGVFRLQFKPMQIDPYYQAALKTASMVQKVAIDGWMPKIEAIYREELLATRKQPPYDVFITCRETGFSGKESMEHKAAVELYDKLTKKGFSVFAPEVNQSDLPRIKREPFIFSAVNMSKVMIVLGSKPEAFNDVWVRNALERFLEAKSRNVSKTVIPCFMNIEAYDLPDDLYEYKAFDFSKENALDDIAESVYDFAVPSNISSVVEDVTDKPAEDNKSEIRQTETVESEDKPVETSDKEDTDKKTLVYKPLDDIRYLDRSCRNLKPGDTVAFGSYPQRALSGLENEPLEWEVLCNNLGRLFLISKCALDAVPFNTPAESVLDLLKIMSFGGTEWSKSDLRKWLNGYFFDKAFNDAEKSIIAETIVSGKSQTEVKDKVFCLSVNEVGTYMKNRKTRMAKTTPYAKFKGAYRSPKGYSWWWLRSPGDNPNFAAGVDAEGEVFSFGIDVCSSTYAVRPAIWVKP